MAAWHSGGTASWPSSCAVVQLGNRAPLLMTSLGNEIVEPVVLSGWYPSGSVRTLWLNVNASGAGTPFAGGAGICRRAEKSALSVTAEAGAAGRTNAKLARIAIRRI